MKLLLHLLTSLHGSSRTSRDVRLGSAKWAKAAHGNHPVLTMCVANTVIAVDDAGNRKPSKRKSTRRIDGMKGDRYFNAHRLMGEPLRANLK